MQVFSRFRAAGLRSTRAAATSSESMAKQVGVAASALSGQQAVRAQEAVAKPASALSTMVRKSPFYDRAVAAGITKWGVYSHVFAPAAADPDKEYAALVNDCILWDVCFQRQISFLGPDALKMSNLVCTRDLSKLKTGWGCYAPMCDNDGIVVNDPIILKYGDQRYDFSIANTDVQLMAQGLQHALKLDCKIVEQNISTLAIMGPKSRLMMADLLGGEAPDIKFYQWTRATIAGVPLIIMRSGFSPEFGYELLIDNLYQPEAERLWDFIVETGKKHGQVIAAPNQARRIEAGLLNVGADIKYTVSGTPNELAPHNALELCLPKKMVNLEKDDFVGRDALREIQKKGEPTRAIVGITLDQNPDEETLMDSLEGAPRAVAPVETLLADGREVGQITSRAFSPLWGKHVCLATVEAGYKGFGTKLEAEVNGKLVSSTVQPLPFGAKPKPAL